MTDETGPPDGSSAAGLAYATPQALLDAISARVRNTVVAGSPYTASELRRQLAYDRLLARVFTADPERWVLKGAGNLLARIPEAARFSLDIDLFYQGELDTSVEALRSIAQLDLGDHFRFEVGRPRGELIAAEGLTLPITSRVGPRLFEPFSVDLVIEMTMTGPPDEIGPLHPIDIEGLPMVRYRCYPVADQIADKHCAVIERHGRHRDLPSTRYRDLVDLVLIAITHQADASRLCAALASEFARRDLDPPRSFEVPEDGDWEAGYRRAAQDAPGLTVTELADAIEIVRTFLNPILKGRDVTIWSPQTRTWST